MRCSMLYAQTIPFYIGTYTKGGLSEGIYRSELDLESGAIADCVLAAKSTNPTFLTLNKDCTFLYGSSESDGQGAVEAFKVDAKSGSLEFVNRQRAGGSSTCHVVIDRTGRYLFAASYGSGIVSVTAIKEDGSLGETSCLVQHESETAVDGKIKAPHAHSVNLSGDNRFVFVADLGLDKVMIYRFDADKGVISPNEPAFVRLKPGSGPRHTRFAPDGRHLYVINELDSTISVLAYDGQAGVLKEVQAISTLEAGFTGWNACAEVCIDPQGKFLYGSNRGHNSIAVFSINQSDGTLKPVGHQKAGIDTPRNFAIDPSGKFCLVANQKSDSIIVFKINPQTGALEPTENKIKVEKPVCILFRR